MRVFLFGAYGRLGSVLSSVLLKNSYSVLRQGRQASAECCFDPTNHQLLMSELQNYNPDVIVNLIGLTNLQTNETNNDLALLVNTKIPEYITRHLTSRPDKKKPKLIHISTDQVYSKEGFNTEEDALPINRYGKTKLLGEKFAIAAGGIVLRTNYIGTSEKSDLDTFSDWAVKSLRQQTTINAFCDIYLNPVHVSTLCNLIQESIYNYKPGIYNVGCRGFFSKADLILEIARGLNLSSEPVKLVNANFPDGVKRPKNMVMDVSKFEENFGIKLPCFREEFEKTLKDYL